MVNLGPIDFQLGLTLNINRNEGQNKIEVHISKNVAKMANFWPKTGQDTTFAPTLNLHNSAILSDFDVRQHQNDYLGETNRMPIKYKLYLSFEGGRGVPMTIFRKSTF